MSPSWELDLERLDRDDPFEIDDVNAPHLAKHEPFTAEDVYDAFFDDPVFVDAPHEPAVWIMIAEIPGDLVIVPLVRAHDESKIRPIGIYKANDRYMEVYRDAWR